MFYFVKMSSVKNNQKCSVFTEQLHRTSSTVSTVRQCTDDTEGITRLGDRAFSVAWNGLSASVTTAMSLSAFRSVS